MNGKFFPNIGSMLLLLTLSVGCQKDEKPVVDAQLVVSPALLQINDNQTGQLFLSVQPAAPFDWQISQQPDWLELSVEAGQVNTQVLEISVTPVIDNLQPGKHFGTIEFISNGAGTAKVQVQLCVEGHPEASVSSSLLQFSAGDTQQRFTISNVGTGFLNWNLIEAPSWIQFEPTGGILDGGQSTEVLASISPAGLPSGSRNGQVVLTSNSEKGDITLTIKAEIPELAMLAVSTEQLLFDYFTADRSFFIENTGNTSANWSIRNANTYLRADPPSGILAPGEIAEVALTLDRSGWLSSQNLTTQIFIEGGQGQSLPLSVAVNHYHETKWSVPGHIIDAEYDRTHDQIIAVAQFPNSLRIFDPIDVSDTRIALSLPPTCVSVSPDGNFAVVGHDAAISYIDLRSRTIKNIYAVTAGAYDIVLAANGYAYIFPERDQWTQIRCIDLSTGVETLHEGNLVYAKTRAKLHPSGTAIYGANTGLSPSDFEKYSIARGTADYQYDSPYHGDYDFAGDLWISEDGKRLFARSRNVFHATADQANDMTYNGKLAGEGEVYTLDHSTAANRVYAVFSTGHPWERQPAGEVRRYGAEFLSFQGATPLPTFLVPNGNGGGTLYQSLGYFGFFNAAGSNFYVLVRAEPGSGAQNEWAIVTIPVQ